MLNHRPDKLARILKRKYPEIYKRLVAAKLATIDENELFIERKMSQLEQIKVINSTLRRRPKQHRGVYVGRSHIRLTFVHPKPKDWYSQLESE